MNHLVFNNNKADVRKAKKIAEKHSPDLKEKVGVRINSKTVIFVPPDEVEKTKEKYNLASN